MFFQNSLVFVISSLFSSSESGNNEIENIFDKTFEILKENFPELYLSEQYYNQLDVLTDYLYIKLDREKKDKYILTSHNNLETSNNTKIFDKNNVDVKKNINSTYLKQFVDFIHLEHIRPSLENLNHLLESSNNNPKILKTISHQLKTYTNLEKIYGEIEFETNTNNNNIDIDTLIINYLNTFTFYNLINYLIDFIDKKVLTLTETELEDNSSPKEFKDKHNIILEVIKFLTDDRNLYLKKFDLNDFPSVELRTYYYRYKDVLNKALKDTSKTSTNYNNISKKQKFNFNNNTITNIRLKLIKHLMDTYKDKIDNKVFETQTTFLERYDKDTDKHYYLTLDILKFILIDKYFFHKVYTLLEKVFEIKIKDKFDSLESLSESELFEIFKETLYKNLEEINNQKVRLKLIYDKILTSTKLDLVQKFTTLYMVFYYNFNSQIETNKINFIKEFHKDLIVEFYNTDVERFFNSENSIFWLVEPPRDKNYFILQINTNKETLENLFTLKNNKELLYKYLVEEIYKVENILRYIVKDKLNKIENNISLWETLKQLLIDNLNSLPYSKNNFEYSDKLKDVLGINVKDNNKKWNLENYLRFYLDIHLKYNFESYYRKPFVDTLNKIESELKQKEQKGIGKSHIYIISEWLFRLMEIFYSFIGLKNILFISDNRLGQVENSNTQNLRTFEINEILSFLRDFNNFNFNVDNREKIKWLEFKNIYDLI